MNSALDAVSIVLYEPQNDINIGNVVRACRNFGITDLRLVRPRVGDHAEIERIAPRSEEFIAKNLKRYEDLESALADTVFVAGATARPRKGNWIVSEPRELAKETVKRAGQGKVALMFGREDSGLPNEALDRCHHLITIPTNPDYSSLNLGQAAMLVAWETFRAAEGIDAHEDDATDLVEVEQIERMLSFAEDALETVEFFKSDGKEHVMRAVRNVLMRADLTPRELAIWFGIWKEIPAYVERNR